jgi:hypothetical protein
MSQADGEGFYERMDSGQLLRSLRAIWYDSSIEALMTVTPELKQAIEKAGDEPERAHEPDTHRAYVVIKEDL